MRIRVRTGLWPVLLVVLAPSVFLLAALVPDFSPASRQLFERTLGHSLSVMVPDGPMMTEDWYDARWVAPLRNCLWAVMGFTFCLAIANLAKGRDRVANWIAVLAVFAFAIATVYRSFSAFPF